MHREEPATGFLFIISGPSGVGKDAVLSALRQPLPQMHYVITATTRAPRERERDGVDYYFVSDERFQEMRKAGELLESSVVHGSGWYGPPKQPVRQALRRGQDVIMRIDVQGVEKIRKQHPQAITIFLIAESMDELRRRILARGLGKDDNIETRMETAKAEMARLEEFDYVVPNFAGRLDETVAMVAAIIRAEHCRTRLRRVTL